VVETSMVDTTGVRTDYRYNGSGYRVSETHQAEGHPPMTVRFERDPPTNISAGHTITCQGLAGEATRTTQTLDGPDDLGKWEIIARECLGGARVRKAD
jgi:YD repeat-containing protein